MARGTNVSSRHYNANMHEIDIAVKAPDDQLKLVAEIKTRLTDAAISQLRHFGASKIPTLSESTYFMLVTPQKTLLWKGPPMDPSPDFAFDTREILGSFCKSLQTPLDQLNLQSFQLLIWSWLSYLTTSDRSASAELKKTGLIDAIKDGRVDDNLAA